MVKHTETICWLLPTNCLSVFDHFVVNTKVNTSVTETFVKVLIQKFRSRIFGGTYSMFLVILAMDFSDQF